MPIQTNRTDFTKLIIPFFQINIEADISPYQTGKYPPPIEFNQNPPQVKCMGKKTISENEINAILSPADIKQQQQQEKKIRSKFWPTFKNALTQLPFAEDVVTAYFCALDKNTPAHVRGVLLAALAYFVLPADLIPDFIAMIGFGDDVAVLTVALSTLKKHMTPEQREAAKKALEDFKGEKVD